MVNSTLPDEEFVLTLMQIDEAKSVAEEVAGEANALNNLAGSVLKLSEKVEHDHGFLEREANQIDAQKIVKSFYVSGLVHTHSLYQAIIAPNTAGGLLSQAAVQRENYLAFGAEIEGIRTFLSEGKLLIKLPMLPVIWSRSYALTHTIHSSLRRWRQGNLSRRARTISMDRSTATIRCGKRSLNGTTIPVCIAREA